MSEIRTFVHFVCRHKICLKSKQKCLDFEHKSVWNPKFWSRFPTHVWNQNVWKPHSYWVSDIHTFIFQMLYLQYLGVMGFKMLFWVFYHRSLLCTTHFFPTSMVECSIHTSFTIKPTDGKFKFFLSWAITVNVWNPNVRISDSSKIWTKASSDFNTFRFRTFGIFGTDTKR